MATSSQRFWKLRLHSADMPAGLWGVVSHCCASWRKASCCICSQEAEAFR